jgi:hypothetical protein
MAIRPDQGGAAIAAGGAAAANGHAGRGLDRAGGEAAGQGVARAFDPSADPPWRHAAIMADAMRRVEPFRAALGRPPPGGIAPLEPVQWITPKTITSTKNSSKAICVETTNATDRHSALIRPRP